MKRPNSQRNINEVDNYTYNSNVSAISLIDEDRYNNKTELIKLRRNLLQTNFQVKDDNDDISSNKIIC